MTILVRQVIEGESVVVGGRRLTPMARLIAWNRQRAVVQSRGLSAFGVAAGWLQPVAVLEETAEGGHVVIPIRDETLCKMVVLLMVAALVPLLLNLLAHLASRPPSLKHRKVT